MSDKRREWRGTLICGNGRRIELTAPTWEGLQDAARGRTKGLARAVVSGVQCVCVACGGTGRTTERKANFGGLELPVKCRECRGKGTFETRADFHFLFVQLKGRS